MSLKLATFSAPKLIGESSLGSVRNRGTFTWHARGRHSANTRWLESGVAFEESRKDPWPCNYLQQREPSDGITEGHALKG